MKRLAMNEDVTILTSANHKSLIKTFSGINFTEQSFAIDKYFHVSEETISDLQSLSKALEKNKNGPTRTIIRG